MCACAYMYTTRYTCTLGTVLYTGKARVNLHKVIHENHFTAYQAQS